MANAEDALRALACVVNTKFDGIHEECSACGVLISPQQGLILSHGSLLAEYCLKEKSFFSKVKKGAVIKGSDIKTSECEALIDSRWMSQFPSLHTSAASKKSISLSEQSCYPTSSTSFTRIKCTLLYALRNEHFFKVVCKIMPESSWTFITGCSEDAATDHNSCRLQPEVTDQDENIVYFNLLSYFLVLKIEPLTANLRNETILSAVKMSMLSRRNCRIGDTAEIVATPFASQNPSVFFNTFSRGIVCNVNGVHGCWILTDARCIPGSEGGPLFTAGKDNQTRNLTGIVAASLCWKNKEWIGFSLACSINSIFNTLDFYLRNGAIKVDFVEWIDKRRMTGICAISIHEDSSIMGEKNRLLSSTVLVKVGSTWGSGVICNKEQGIILTCSHVVKDSHNFEIMIKPYQGSSQYKATLIYRTSGSLQKPYDIAILKCPEATAGFCVHEVPKIVVPRLGDQVYVVGHALFSVELDLHPSICAGVISKVITFKGQHVMVQSTCAVHPGASGGPLINVQGDLVGVVVCNTVNKSSNSSYPHVNMSIPAISIWPPISHFIQTGDSSGFSAFDLTDPRVKRLWALDNSILDGAERSARSKL